MDRCCKETIRRVIRVAARQEGVQGLSNFECDSIWRKMTEQDQKLSNTDRELLKSAKEIIRAERT